MNLYSRALFAISVSFAAAAQPLPPLRIGATAVPHAELLKAIAPQLQAQGVQLDVHVYQDYGLPNIDVARGAIDANFFQTEPYLWRWRAAHGAPLVVAGRVHVEPMGIYASRKIHALNGVHDGGVVSLPQDPANLGRALALLQKAGLLRVDERRGLDAVVADVVDNPHHFKFRLIPAGRAAEQLGSSELTVVNGNFALQARLPSPLFLEGTDSPFPNVIVTREDLAHDKRVEALVAALRGAEARQYLQTHYSGAALPAD
jgi:D-methionine transport system substrate-binding protein